MIQEITNAALAPFMETIGWQGFAYGLLGLKTLKRAFTMVRGFVGGNDGDNTTDDEV